MSTAPANPSSSSSAASRLNWHPSQEANLKTATLGLSLMLSMLFQNAVTTDARQAARHAEKTNKFFFASFAPLRDNCFFSQLLTVAAPVRAATVRERLPRNTRV